MTTIFGHCNVLSFNYQSILYFDSSIKKWLKVYHIVFILLYLEEVRYWRTPKLFGRLKMSLKYETKKRLGTWGTLLNTQHFRGVEGRAGAPDGIKKSDKQFIHSHKLVEKWQIS
jgi:hypothetical protein